MMLDTVSRLIQDRTVHPARVFKSGLDALVDQMVSGLVPLLAAEERVLGGRVDGALRGPLSEDGRLVRQLVERLSMLSEGLEGPPRRAVKTERLVLTTLHQMAICLDALRTHRHAVLRHLIDTLPLEEQARLAATVEAAAQDAREQTMLIVRPATPPTAATVLRNRPDLNAAYALSLAEIERRVHRGTAPKGEKNGVTTESPE